MSEQNSSFSKVDVRTLPERTWLSDLALLFKMRLSSLVIFSSVIAYFAAGGGLDWYVLTLLTLGGALVTWASGALNQVIEKDTDALMTRTKERPLVQNRMTSSSAVLLAGLMSLVGMTMLAMINPAAGLLGAMSFILYAFIYTPLKRVSQISVIVGAVPGALPTAIGAVAAAGSVNEFVVFIFLMQFFWQFPHFWGIAWVADEDYKRAGFKMLPGIDGAKDKWTGVLSLFFCLALIALGLFAWNSGILSIFGFVAFSLINLYFAYSAYQHIMKGNDQSARSMMFASFFHLPLALIFILIDRTCF
jgi:heme o synthase